MLEKLKNFLQYPCQTMLSSYFEEQTPMQILTTLPSIVLCVGHLFPHKREQEAFLPYL